MKKFQKLTKLLEYPNGDSYSEFNDGSFKYFQKWKTSRENGPAYHNLVHGDGNFLFYINGNLIK